MSRLSEHFNDTEFRCNCGCGVSYTDSRLIKALEELRVIINKPIKILSGYRCVKNNAEAGGGKNSQHLYGKAADISVASCTLKALYEAALLVPDFADGGIGIYPNNNFIHVDVRNGKARWARIKKKKGADVYVSIEEGLKALT